MAYEIHWQLWDVDLPESALRVWQKDRVKQKAEGLVDSRSLPAPTLYGAIRPMLGQELRDWVLRGGERFMPLPDHVLDAYWRAHRGLTGFYDPLLLGLKAKRYLGLGGSGEIGEGVALAVVETPAPDGLGLMAICRPLGTAPDFICQHLGDPTMRPLVEVKATENDGELRRCLVEGVVTLLDIYRAWQRHRPLCHTPALAIAVLLSQTGFQVQIVRLRFRGKDLVELRPRDHVAPIPLRTAKKAVWASQYIEAAKALDQVLADQDSETIDMELSTLVEVKRSSISALAVRDRALVEGLPRPKKGKRKRDAKDERREAIREVVEAHGIRFDGDAIRVAEELAEEVNTLRQEERERQAAHWDEEDWLHDEKIGNWNIVAQPRADGLELRAFRHGELVTPIDVLHRALSVLETKGKRRYRPGHAAVAAWIEGIEWAAFCDGRLQGWLPEVERVHEEGAEAVDAAKRIIWAWEDGVNRG